MTESYPDKKVFEKKLHEMQEDAEKSGYHLNPDKSLITYLIKGLLTNEKRYGFESCPCRLTIGNKENNLDIICPCDYRDTDILDYGSCYCALYVSEDVFFGKKSVEPIPDRRFDEKTEYTQNNGMEIESGLRLSLKYPILRCRVCGYLCARERPPERCPICKAGSERFEKYL